MILGVVLALLCFMFSDAVKLFIALFVMSLPVILFLALMGVRLYE